MHDGKLILVLGDPGAGKDSYINWAFGNQPFVLVQSEPNNQTMWDMDYILDTDDNLKKAREKIIPGIFSDQGYPIQQYDQVEYIHRIMIRFREGEDVNPKIFNLFKCIPNIWLGDVNYWFTDWHRGQAFKNYFLRYIRGRDQLVYGSTHFVTGDVLPVVSQYARQIIWVGPFADRPERAKDLYGLKSAGMFPDFNYFEAKLRGLEKFQWNHPNPEMSILLIKDEG